MTNVGFGETAVTTQGPFVTGGAIASMLGGIIITSIFIGYVRLEDALGLHLCQRLDWHSPSKLPAPMEWVSVCRIRVKPSVEPTVQLRSIVFSQ